MSKLYFELALVGGLVACGSNSSNTTDAPKTADAKVYLDAPTDSGSGSNTGSGALACNGNAAPTPNAQVTATGTIEVAALSGTSVSLSPLSGGTVDVCTGDCTAANKLSTQTTDANGKFTAGPFTTNGTAIPAYLTITSTGNVTTLAYSPEPMAQDTAFQAFVFPTSLVTLLNGVCGQTAGDGVIGMLVTDCNNAPITDTTNIKVSVTQNGTAVGGTPLDVGSLAPALKGFFLVCAVPVGATTVNATYMTKTFLANDVMSVANQPTEAVIRPGY